VASKDKKPETTKGVLARDRASQKAAAQKAQTIAKNAAKKNDGDKKKS
jgi:hypothetical protein